MQSNLKSASYLYSAVKDAMREKQLLQADICKGTGIRKEYISRFLAAKGKNDLEFSTVLALMRFLYPQEYLDMMDTYSLKLEKPMGIINSLEYASNFGRDELLDELIAINTNHKKSVIREWVEVYALDRSICQKSCFDIMDSCRYLYGKVSSHEMQIKLDLIEAIATYRNDYTGLIKMRERINRKIKLLRSGFIKESFMLRYCNLLANALLYSEGASKKAIEYAEQVISSSSAPLFLVASAYHISGHAKMYDDKEGSLRDLKKAANLFGSMADYEKHAQSLLKNDMNFIRNFHKDELDLSLLEGEELAHQLIIQGEGQKAVAVLERLDTTDPFNMLYMGMAKKDVSLIVEAHGKISKVGKTFFKRIFERELYQLFNEKGAIFK